MIKDSRNIIPIYEDFLKIINTEENKNKTIFIYNEGFDLSTIYRSLNYAGYKYKENNDFDDVEFRSRCVMKDFAYFMVNIMSTMIQINTNGKSSNLLQIILISK
jgi:hypothetical protein